jgi:hypothetical protein
MSNSFWKVHGGFSDLPRVSREWELKQVVSFTLQIHVFIDCEVGVEVVLRHVEIEMVRNVVMGK